MRPARFDPSLGSGYTGAQDVARRRTCEDEGSASADISAWRLPPLLSGYAALAVALGAGVYLPILRSYFHSEDFWVLHNIANRPFAEWGLPTSGGHLAIGRNLVFAATYAWAGANPVAFFGSVLAVHAANTALLFGTIWIFTRSARLACAGATAWAVSPMNEGVLGWYTCFGQALVTMTFLVALLLLGRSAREPGPPSRRTAVVWVLLMLIGALTFGYGLGVAVVFPLSAMLVLGNARLSRDVRAILFALPVAVVILYGLFGAGTTLVSSPGDVAAMLFHLLSFGITSVVAGFWVPPTAYPFPGAYAIAAGVAVVALAGFALASPPARRMLLGVGLFVAASYGSLALGRAGFTRYTGDPVFGAGSIRYHYAGTAMLTIGVCMALAGIGGRLRLAAPWSDVLLWAWLGGASLGYWNAGWTIDHFDAERRRVEVALQGIRAAVERTPVDQPVFIVNQPFVPDFGIGTFPFFAGWASLYAIYFRSPPGRPVYFIDAKAGAWSAALAGSRLAHALFPPAEGRPDTIMCPVRVPLWCGSGG